MLGALGRVTGRPAAARRGRRSRAAHAAHERAHQPRRAAPPPRPRPEHAGRVLDDLHAETEELVGLVEEVVALARGVTDGTPVGARSSWARWRGGRGRAGRAPARSGGHRRPPTTRSSRRRRRPLERAISNLVDNAAKFDPSGGPIEIVVAGGRRRRARPRARASRPATRPALFDRFYRADDARALPGSGLGLSIVRDVAVAQRRHGRGVGAPGGGAERRLPLPVVDLPLVGPNVWDPQRRRHDLRRSVVVQTSRCGGRSGRRRGPRRRGDVERHDVVGRRRNEAGRVTTATTLPCRRSNVTTPLR